MKKLLSLLTASAMLTFAQAQDYGQAATIRIWDNATAPHSNGIATPEVEVAPYRIGNTSDAELYLFPADRSVDTGKAVVICPGGGYTYVSIDQEGYQMAEWFAAHGITAAVLKYRMPNGHPEVPLEDARQALRILMGLEAGATGFSRDQVGILGCSAGGHLAAMASTMTDTKPAFSILFYPVITGDGTKAHKGSFDRLLGKERTPAQTFLYSLEHRVTGDTPPTLLLLSDDDRTVPPVNSMLYYTALKSNGIRASMHVYPSGGHGWGIRDSFPYKEAWQAALLEWLGTL